MVLLQEDINNLRVVSAIIDLVVLGSSYHVLVPGVVDGPRSSSPLSHLVVVLDRRVSRLLLSHPVHDLVVIG